MLFIIVFICVLFFYIHIYYHFKINNDLDMIEIEYCSFDYLQEICDYRQPVLFSLQLNTIPPNVMELFAKYDIRIDRENNHSAVEQTLSLAEYNKKEKKEKYISCKNYAFLADTGLIDKLRLLDPYIRPTTTIKCMYDLYFAHKNTFTTLEYNLSYRTYIRVEEGKGKVILIPPKYKKFIYPQDHIGLFSFTSPINPWNVQKEFEHGYSKVNTVEKDISAGDIISIPAYWYFSIQCTENTILSKYNYWTSMNIVSIIPTLIMSSFQHNP